MLLFFFSAGFSFDIHWCEPPLPEYEGIPNADLVQVQIITRHGARTPLHISKNFSNLWICNETEIFSIDSKLSRPMKVNNAFGKSVFLGDCIYSQLTGKGADALFRLGKYIHNIYVDRLKFLPTTIKPTIMKFRSTSTHRTIHSSMAFISGLYEQRPSINLELAEKTYDHWRRASELCPKLKESMDSLKGSAEWNSLNLTNDELESNMSKSIGTKWSSTNDISTSSRCNNLPLPPNVDISRLDEATLLKARQMQFVYAHSSVYPLFFSFCAAEMVNHMSERLNGNSSIRFIHWSAHDGNILGYLGYLGYADGKWPPYGSYIVTELWQQKNGKAIVRILFNGKPIKVPRMLNSVTFPFTEYKKFVVNHLPDLKFDCGFNQKKFFQSTVKYSD